MNSIAISFPTTPWILWTGGLGILLLLIWFLIMAPLEMTPRATRFVTASKVEAGHRGVWRSALAPGKYALNPYAVKVELVPTINFVLRWISGQTEAHHYDEDLSSIDLITADGYEPR